MGDGMSLDRPAIGQDLFRNAIFLKPLESQVGMAPALDGQAKGQGGEGKVEAKDAEIGQTTKHEFPDLAAHLDADHQEDSRQGAT